MQNNGQRICQVTKKICHDNKKKANSRANELFKENGKLLNVYKCNHCHCWHMTKQETRVTAKPKKLKTTFLHRYKQFKKYLAA